MRNKAKLYGNHKNMAGKKLFVTQNEIIDIFLLFLKLMLQDPKKQKEEQEEKRRL